MFQVLFPVLFLLLFLDLCLALHLERLRARHLERLRAESFLHSFRLWLDSGLDCSHHDPARRRVFGLPHRLPPAD